MIKQFVPQEFCLKCQGCCRFKEMNSVWSPCLLEEEIQDLLDRDIPPATITINKKIGLIPNPKGEGFICDFFDAPEDKCRIYNFRPFECQLYPFLINLRHNKLLLTVDLNCPYIKEKSNTKEFKDYVLELTHYLNSPAVKALLKSNPQILQAYEEVQDVIELEAPDEPG